MNMGEKFKLQFDELLGSLKKYFFKDISFFLNYY